jgi:predicted nucleotidyltransferase
VKLRVYNKTLDPTLWDDKTLKPEVRESLLKIAEDFYNSTDLKGEIQNVLFLGSSANYNWTPTSDIDIHIVIDIAEERINEEYARKFMDGLAFKWNTEHDLEVKGHPVEVYLQDIREPNSSPQQARKGASIYSLYDGKWLLEPNPQDIKLDPDKIRKKFKLIKKKIEALVQTEDVEKLKELMKSIRNYRDAGLAAGGEFSVENIVFKALRHSGDLKNIKDTITTIYDKKASLPEGGNVLPQKKTEPLNELEGKYLIVGWINKDLEILEEKDTVGNNKINHQTLVKKNPQFMYMDDESKAWRYKSKTNILYWYDEPSDRQRFVVVDYLNNKYGIVNPRQTTTSDLSGHKIDEELGKPFLVVGVVTDDLSVQSIISYESNASSHDKVVRNVWDNSNVRWRYKSKTNTIYWAVEGYDKLVPTTNQREEVIAHLRDKYKVINPRETSDANKYFFDAHSIDEFSHKKV